MSIFKRNISVGFLYFYVHFITEVVCFFMLGKYVGTGPEVWVWLLAYDMLAFVPQAIIGFVSDRFRRIPFGIIGLLLLAVSLPLFFRFTAAPYFALIILCVLLAVSVILVLIALKREDNGDER